MPILSPAAAQSHASSIAQSPSDDGSGFGSTTNTVLTFDAMPKTTFGAGTGYGDFYFFGGQIQEIKIDKKRAFAIHEIPYQDADLLENMGMHSAVISMTLLYVNGAEPNAYPQYFSDLQAQFEAGAKGYLTLPSGKQRYCEITDLSELLSVKRRDGAEVKVTFKETLPLGSIAMPSTPSVPTSIVPALSNVNLQTVSTTNLQNISTATSLLSDVTGALSQGFAYLLSVDGAINALVGKVQTILALVDLIDEEIPGEYAYLRVFLQGLQFTLYQQQTATVSPAGVRVLNVMSAQSISQICRSIGIDIDSFFTLNPQYLGQLTIGPDQIVIYTQTGSNRAG